MCIYWNMVPSSEISKQFHISIIYLITRFCKILFYIIEMSPFQQKIFRVFVFLVFLLTFQWCTISIVTLNTSTPISLATIQEVFEWCYSLLITVKRQETSVKYSNRITYDPHENYYVYYTACNWFSGNNKL